MATGRLFDLNAAVGRTGWQRLIGPAYEARKQATAPGEYRWIVLGVLFVSRFCLGFQFQSAGSVAPFLIDDFALNHAEVGTLIGLYMLPGLVVALPGGV